MTLCRASSAAQNRVQVRFILGGLLVHVAAASTSAEADQHPGQRPVNHGHRSVSAAAARGGRHSTHGRRTDR